METGRKDKVVGTLHQLQGKVKEVAGFMADNPKREAEGASERIAGKVQVKIGQFNQFWGK
jgi:uncharacterized protein YjbJ (UPF0337 family)